MSQNTTNLSQNPIAGMAKPWLNEGVICSGKESNESTNKQTTHKQNRKIQKAKTMKKIKMTTMMGVPALALVLATNAQAQMNITLYDDTSLYSNGDGGEFMAVGNTALDNRVDWSAYSTSTASTTPSGNPYSFQTFCTELHEDFSPGTTYTVSFIGLSAMYNGSQPPTPVPLTMGVAYLYSQFAAGTLGGYDYTYGGGRSATAGVLQNAIWYLLGEGGYLDSSSFVYTDLVSGLGSNSAKWIAPDTTGAYGVADMVLGLPGAAQDQLVMAPVPEASTMLAGALMLLPLGVSAIRIVRKSRMA